LKRRAFLNTKKGYSLNAMAGLYENNTDFSWNTAGATNVIIQHNW
jgi:hypothetical protein